MSIDSSGAGMAPDRTVALVPPTLQSSTPLGLALSSRANQSQKASYVTNRVIQNCTMNVVQLNLCFLACILPMRTLEDRANIT